MRQVCKTWKSIVDHGDALWQHAYVTRFHPVDEETNQDDDDDDPNESLGVSSVKRSFCWRELFMSKYLAERRIRFMRHKKTGWKVRTCGHVGCLDVLRSPEQMKRHYEMHQKHNQRRRARNLKRQIATIAATEKRPTKRALGVASRKRA